MTKESDDLFSMFQGLENQEDIRENYCRAPIGYIGSKSQSLKYILPELPQSDTYVEVFAGSASVLLARNPSKLEIYNDRNSGITAFYRCLRDGQKLDKLINRLQYCLHGREEFIYCRDTWKDCEDDVERGVRWYYTITCSFGVQGRNFGRVRKGKNQIAMKLKNSIKDFYHVHQRLLNVCIENQDWRFILKDFDSPTTVFYLDPPYLQSISYTGLYDNSMKDEDHREMLERIFQTEGFVAVSSYANQMYDNYPWTKKVEWETTVFTSAGIGTQSNNRIDTVSDKKRKAQEVLYIKDFS